MEAAVAEVLQPSPSPLASSPSTSPAPQLLARIILTLGAHIILAEGLSATLAGSQGGASRQVDAYDPLEQFQAILQLQSHIIGQVTFSLGDFQVIFLQFYCDLLISRLTPLTNRQRLLWYVCLCSRFGFRVILLI